MANEDKHIFVTGGAGYVGSTLVPDLLDKGHQVTVYDLFIYGDTLPDHSNLKKVKGDIRDEQLLRESMGNIDACIHLACISNDPSFDLDPELGKSINYEAFPPLVQAARESGAERFLLASSTSQYGIKPVEMNVTEDTPADPLTDYARYKLYCEEAMQNMDTGDMAYTFVRPSTLCGYAPRLRLDLIVNILTMHALENKKITVFGGEQLRPALHVKDMSRFYQHLLDEPREHIHGEAFNVSLMNATATQYANMIKETLGDDNVEIVFKPTDDKRSYHVDASKAENKLGFTYDHSIQDAVVGLKEAYQRGDIVDGLTNPKYHNIKRMQEMKLT